MIIESQANSCVVDKERVLRQASVLLIERNPQMKRALRVTLERNDYHVLVAEQQDEALNIITSASPQMILLGIDAENSSGIEFCRELRHWTSVPVIIISDVSLEEYKIRALDFGADDYVTRPFSMGEFLARVRAVARRCKKPVEPEKRQIFQYKNLTIDFYQRLVTVNKKVVRLTPKEYELLEYMSRNVNRVLTHRMLLGQVWGSDYMDDTHTLFVHMANLRNKLEAKPNNIKLIHTERKIGYRFVAVDLN